MIMKSKLMGVILCAIFLSGCVQPDNDQIIAETQKCYAGGLDAVSVVRGIECVPPQEHGPSNALALVRIQYRVEQLEARVEDLEAKNQQLIATVLKALEEE